jgi:RHS repeat-associated protein
VRSLRPCPPSVSTIFSRRQIIPLLRQIVALTLVWAIVLADFPGRLPELSIRAMSRPLSRRTSHSVGDEFASRLSLPTTFASRPTNSGIRLANSTALAHATGSAVNASSVPLTTALKTPTALSAGMPGPTDLVAAYSFEEGSGTTTADSSGNNNTGTLSSGVTWTTGKVGHAVAFDGTSGDITVNSAASLDLNGSFTLSAWVKPTTVSGSQTLLIKETTADSCSYFLQIEDGEIDSGFNNGSGCIEHITTNANLSAGNWYHFVAVLDHGSNTYNTYLNGDLISSVAETGVPVPNTQALLIGRSGYAGGAYERLNGVLDEVNIYDRALSASEVQALYNAGAAGPTITGLNPTSGAVGTRVTIVGTSFGATQQSSTVTFNGVQSNPTSWSATSIIAPVPSGATSGNVVVTVGGTSSNGVNFSVSSAGSTGPVAAYPFEEGSGTTTADTSGNNNTGTLSSGVIWTTGKVGNAVEFDGTSGDITVNEASSLDLNGSFTLSAWVKPNTVSGLQTLLIKETIQASCSYFLQIEDGEIDSGFNNGSGCIEHITTNANLSAGNWYHFVAVLDHGNNMYDTYLNGDLISSVAETGVPVPNTQALLMGRSGYAGGAYERLNGVLDEVNIYNRALDGSEVQALYNAGNSNSSNQPPTVSAGGNQTIELPTNTATLNGSASSTVPAGSPVTVQWSEVSGPGSVTFANATQATTQATFPVVGTYVLQLSATVTATGLSASAQTTVTVAPVNQPPSVSVGPDQVIAYPTVTANLTGTATDDGYPVGSSLLILWSKVAGPGTVTFANPAQPNTQASFSLPGNYEIRLSASDGQYTSAATMRVTFVGPAGGPLSINAGANQVIVFPGTATLAGTVSDPFLPSGGVVAVQWTQVSGPGVASFSSSTSLSTTASFSQQGMYDLRLSATDGVSSGSSDVQVYVGHVSCTLSNKGTNFWLMFIAGQASNERELELAISGDSATSGVLTVPGASFTQAFQITPGQVTSIVIPVSTMVTTSDQVENKGIHITALAPVAVSAVNYDPHATDGFLGLPTTALGTSYMVAAYENGPPGTEFGLVATMDATNVTIIPTVTTGTRQSGVPYSVQLNAGQTYQLLNQNSFGQLNNNQGAPSNFTGSIVTSDKPVAVFGGHICTNVPADSATCNALVEQLPPVDLWGTDFVTVPLATELKGDFFRILASTPATHVKLNGQLVATLEKGEFVEELLTAPSVINTDAPVLVVQYAASQVFAGTGNLDPSMAVIPAFEQFGGKYTISTPPDGFDNINFVNISAPTAAASSGGILLDGAPVPANGFVAIGNSGFSGAQVPIAKGTHNLSSAVPFGVLSYGFNTADAYSYTGGVCYTQGEAGNTIAVSPKTTTNQITSQISLTAVVNDQYGNPAGGIGVAFQVTGANSATATVTTDSTGTAVFTYRGLAVGTDSATASIDSAIDAAILTWIGNGPNQAPVVSAGPPLTVSLPTNTANLIGSVIDDGLPVGAALTSQWSEVSGPAAVTFANANQAVTRATFSQAGTYVLQLTASDTALSSSSSTTIVVYPPNQPPVVSAGPDQELPFIIGNMQTASLSGTATDDGLPLGSTLTLLWRQVSGPGTVSFTNPTAAATTATFSSPGFYTLALSGNDGQIITTAYAGINLAIPAISAPATVQGSPNASISLLGSVTLDGVPAGSSVPVFWRVLSQPAGSQYTLGNNVAASTTFTANTAGIYQLMLCTQSGSICAPVAVSVIPPGATTPSVSFVTPSDGGEITQPTSIIASVSSGSWTLEYAPENDVNPLLSYTTIATGTGSVASGSVGSLDPTMLLNGLYSLRLRTTDQYGQTASAVINVSVTRNVKVGVFTVTFNDLTVPVGGIPIQVFRGYDSRDKTTGDFGIGWRLSLSNIRVQKTHSLGIGWNQTSQPGAVPQFCMQVPNAALVNVVFPDGRVFRFQESLSQACQQIAPLEATNVVFQELPGPANTAGATLTPLDGGAVLVDGNAPGPVTLLGFDGNTYNPTSYVLTTADGTKYAVDQINGLTSVTDPNGNTLTMSPSGITSSAGKGVTFERDPLGRIINIVDPNGNLLKYAYDTSGNLTQFTDRSGNIYAFTYSASAPFNLSAIIRPDGTNAIANTYDSSGRLHQSSNSFGQSSTFTHDLTNHVETVKDALGNSTAYTYDQDGNVIQTVDPLGNTTSATYDASDNKLSETNGLGKTSNYTYDQLGNRLTESDPLGHTTTYTYNSFSKPLTIQDANGHTTTNTYDPNGNLLTTTDALSHVTTNTYDGKGNLLTTKDPLGNITRFAYDGFGNLQTQTDANQTVTTYTYDGNGNRTSQSVTRTTPGGPQTLLTQYTYDANNRLIKTTYPDGTTTKTAYDQFGQQSSTTDAKGNQTTYGYDTGGHLVSTTYPDQTLDTVSYDQDGRRFRTQARNGLFLNYTYDNAGRLTQTTDLSTQATTTTGYDAAGQVISSKDPRGNITQYAYDDAGRRTTVTDPLTHVTTFTYDNAGNQLTMVDANNHATSYTYDSANRRTRVTYPDTSFESTGYDALGRVVSRTDAKGLTTQYGYDGLGRLTSVTDALSQVTSYGYDEVGNRISQTDANTHTTSYVYDQRGRRLQRTLPLGQTESYVYDANGNLSSRTDFNSRTTTYAYDNMNRLLSKTPDAFFVTNHLGASAVTFTYIPQGRSSMTDASGRTTYNYDSSNHLTGVNRPAGGIGYVYDLAGNLTQMSGTAGIVNYTYDALNRLSTVQETNTGTTSHGYDAVGNLQTVTYPNGVVHGYGYDTRNRLTNLGVNGTVAGAPGAIAGYAYTLDASGHRTGVTELSGRTVSYGYDNLYRLTSETIASDPHSINGVVSYAYDPVGNRTQKTSTLPGMPGGLSNYNANDQLSTDTYDADGNTTASNGNGYVYDFENHLIQQGGVSIVYDGDGNRASKTVNGITTTYLVDTQNPTGYAQVLLESYSGNHGTAFEITHTYVYGLERISERRSFLQNSQGNTANAYYVYDGHGSVRALTDSTGTVTDTYDYDAFGNLIHSTGTTPNNYLFAGEQFDPDLGLYYNRARYLNVSTGRFWTIDTFEGDSDSPFSLHKYLYASSDPVNRFDRSGNEDIAELSVSEAIDGILNTMSQIQKAVDIKNKITSVFELVAAVKDISLDLSTGGPLSSGFETALGEMFGQFAARYSPKQFGFDLAQSLERNASKIATEVGTHRLADVAKFLGDKTAPIAIFLPTPTALPAVTFKMPFSLVGRPVELIFGGGGGGRILGFGADFAGDLNQFLRIDLTFSLADLFSRHPPIGGGPDLTPGRDDYAAWTDDSYFHYHVPKH